MIQWEQPSVVEQFTPEGWTLCYRFMLEQFFKSCNLQEAHAGSIHEGWPPGRAGEESKDEGVAENQELWTDHNLHSPLPYFAKGKEVEEGGWEENGLNLLLDLTLLV